MYIAISRFIHFPILRSFSVHTRVLQNVCAWHWHWIEHIQCFRILCNKCSLCKSVI